MKDLDSFDEVGMWVSTYPCSLMVSGASLYLYECPMKVILAGWANGAGPASWRLKIERARFFQWFHITSCSFHVFCGNPMIFWSIVELKSTQLWSFIIFFLLLLHIFDFQLRQDSQIARWGTQIGQISLDTMIFLAKIVF